MKGKWDMLLCVMHCKRLTPALFIPLSHTQRANVRFLPFIEVMAADIVCKC